MIIIYQQSAIDWARTWGRTPTEGKVDTSGFTQTRGPETQSEVGEWGGQKQNE